MPGHLAARLGCAAMKVIDELEKSLAKQIKENSDLLIKIDNLENVFADEEKRATLGKLNAFDNENCDFESKVIHLEKIIAQKSKDFDDVNLKLSNRTAKFEAYFEKLEKTKVVLERKLARKVDDSKAEKNQFLKEINHLRTQLENLKGKHVETKLDNSLILGKPSLLNNERDQLLKQIASLESKLASQDIHSCQKEYHELRTSYNALKVKFDSLTRKKWNINVSKSSKPKESVSEKVHTGESSKPFLRRVSQFTTYSLQKDRKFFKKSQSFETFFRQKGFKTRTSNAKNQSFETSDSCFTPCLGMMDEHRPHGGKWMELGVVNAGNTQLGMFCVCGKGGKSPCGTPAQCALLAVPSYVISVVLEGKFISGWNSGVVGGCAFFSVEMEQLEGCPLWIFFSFAGMGIVGSGYTLHGGMETHWWEKQTILK
ncbi:hypothetical protein Tco_1410018 [Tanacetum coccineum]